jgi:hypothetical protein
MIVWGSAYQELFEDQYAGSHEIKKKERKEGREYREK